MSVSSSSQKAYRNRLRVAKPRFSRMAQEARLPGNNPTTMSLSHQKGSFDARLEPHATNLSRYEIILVIILLIAVAAGVAMLLQGHPGTKPPLEISLAQSNPTPAPQDTCDLYVPQKVSINRAEAWLLESLPGIGPTLAQNIIEYRRQNGHFAIIEELKLVPGIGEATYEGIKELVTVE